MDCRLKSLSRSSLINISKQTNWSFLVNNRPRRPRGRQSGWEADKNRQNRCEHSLQLLDVLQFVLVTRSSPKSLRWRLVRANVLARLVNFAHTDFARFTFLPPRLSAPGSPRMVNYWLTSNSGPITFWSLFVYDTFLSSTFVMTLICIFLVSVDNLFKVVKKINTFVIGYFEQQLLLICILFLKTPNKCKS